MCTPGDADLPCWDDIPPQLARDIAKKHVYGGETLLSLRRTSDFWKSIVDDDGLWQHLVKCRYGADCKVPDTAQEQTPSVPTWGPWQRLYFEKARLRNCMADTRVSGGAWVDDERYFGRMPDDSSLCKQVLVLHEVWWFDISTAFRGKYKVVWRMRANADGRFCAFEAAFHSYVTTVRSEEDGSVLRSYEGVEQEKMLTCRSWPAASMIVEPVAAAAAAAAATAAATEFHYGYGYDDDGDGEPDQLLAINPAAQAELAEPAAEIDGDPSVADPPGSLAKRFMSHAQIMQLKYIDGWVDVEVGSFRVPDHCAYDITVRMYNTETTCKAGLSWDQVVLQRVPEADQP